MKKGLLFGSVGVIIGILITIVVIYNMAPGLMMIEDVSPYNFEETITKFEESVKTHGWTIPKVHDLQKSMKKFGKDVKAVKVFELCHPDHAGRILAKSEERIVSSLMPCRVAFYEKEDGKVYFSRMNSSLMASMMSGIIPEVMDIAAKDTEKILQVVFEK